MMSPIWISSRTTSIARECVEEEMKKNIIIPAGVAATAATLAVAHLMAPES